MRTSSNMEDLFNESKTSEVFWNASVLDDACGSWCGNGNNATLPYVPVNDTNATLPYISMAARPERYIIPVVFMLILFVGIVGNGALVFFFIKYPQMRNFPNMYILSLAVGDLLVLIFTVPFVSMIFTLESYPFGEIVCRLQETMKDISIGVTVFTLTALSVNRYYAIVQPYSKHTGAKLSTGCTTAIIWLASVVFAIPSALFTSLRYFEKSNREIYATCYPFPDYLPESYPRYNVLAKFLIYYCIPLLIIGTYYVLMALHLVKQDIPGELASQTSNLKRQIASRRKVAKLVLAFVTIFAVCFFPNNVFMMWFYFHPTSHDDYNYVWNSVRIVGFCLSFINSCINPIALYWISGTFRKHYNRHIFRCLLSQECNTTSLSTAMHYHSSTRNYNVTRTDQFEMSTTNGPDRVNV